MPVTLGEIAVAQPEWQVEADEIAAWTGLDEGFIRTRIGVGSRRFLREGETGLDLAERAVRDLGAEGLESIDLLIVVTQNPDHRLPHMGALLQHRLGLPTTVPSFDLNLGCSGFVYGLTVADGFLASTGGAKALIVTVDPYSRIMARTDRDVAGLFGDAATATLVTRTEGPLGTGLPDFGTDGAGAASLIVGGGGAARPIGPTIASPDETPRVLSREDRLYMDGRGVLNMVVDRVPESVRRTLERNGLESGDIDHFVFHQGSRYILDTLRKRMDLPEEKLVIALDGYGNTVSSTIPIAIRDLRRGRELTGKTLLLCGFGVGLSWATNIVRF